MRSVLALGGAWLLTGTVFAQDTARARTLEPVVVTADRTPRSLQSSAAAVYRLSTAQLSQLPHATLAELLRQAPGISSVDLDGLGFDPALIVRGFYGGGEAEYVIVQVDGQPVGQLQSGVVAWDVLPPAASIEAIEVVRGGASSLYGDAAIAGVVNVITHGPANPPERALRWETAAGTYGQLRLGLGLSSASWPLTGALGIDRTSGFRHHAERTAGRALATVPLLQGARRQLVLSLRSHWRSFDEPGPLLASLAELDRRSSDPLFRFDHSNDKDVEAVLSGRRELTPRSVVTGALTGELRSGDAIRTLALAPGFGDTKERIARNERVGFAAQLTTHGAPLPRTDELSLGVEASRGALHSRYYQYVLGTRAQYASALGERGALDTKGESIRHTGALYAQFTGRPSGAVALTLGARLDVLRDSFTPREPAELSGARATHAAFSPKAGLNVQYRKGGNLYLTAGRSFKAPTLDQLYDQRNIPVPFPPYQIQTSNPDLKPQHGTNLEAGLYHSGRLSRASTLQARVTLSVYQMKLRDELDFDVQSFRYVNVGRSRHRGIEGGMELTWRWASLSASHALQSVIAESGDQAGKRLKAIPRQVLFVGAGVHPSRFEARLDLVHQGGSFLDDANTARQPGLTRLDGTVAWRWRGLCASVELRNFLDAHFNSGGFLDPSGSGEAYFYPAAGRVIAVDIRGGW